MKKLTFSDVLITIMIGVVFGITMKFWSDFYTVVKPILPVARQLLYGMWIMVAPFAFLLIRKPGVALLSSIAAAALSAFIGHGFGVLVFGFCLGLAAELLFVRSEERRVG